MDCVFRVFEEKKNEPDVKWLRLVQHDDGAAEVQLVDASGRRIEYLLTLTPGKGLKRVMGCSCGNTGMPVDDYGRVLLVGE